PARSNGRGSASTNVTPIVPAGTTLAAPAGIITTARAAPVPPAIPVEQPVVRPAPANRHPSRPRVEQPIPPSPPQPSLAASRDDEEIALFRAADRLHATAHDPGAALAAWDRYLRLAPDGHFAPEARYNRALCL